MREDRIMKTLQDKISDSIALIRKAERLALALNPEQGFHVGFSGGKDSQVLLELVKMAGVKYRAVYNVTTNDPPENVYFIRKHYPEVVFVNNGGGNLYKMIEKKGLPTMIHRWCCKIYKENAGAGSVVLTGVRAEESRKRAGYNVVDLRSIRKEHQQRTEPYTIEGIEQAQHQCIKGKDKVMVYPMLEWTTTDVWVFIASRRLPVNPCYEISGRVGCMFCPFAKKEQIEFYERRYPQFHRLFLDGLRRYMEKIDKYGITADEYYAIWKSKKSIKDYLRDKANKDAAKRQTELFQNEN